MQGVRSLVLLVVFGMLLLVVQSVLASVLAPHPGEPYLLLPLVAVVAISTEMRIALAACTSFLLGLVMDATTGNALGVHTFAFVIAYVVARVAAIRFAFTGVVSSAVLCALLAVVVGSVIALLRSAFRSFDAIALASTWDPLLLSALSTAVLSAPLMWLGRKCLPEAKPRVREAAP